MPLPPLNSEGELPEGGHHATMDKVLAQFDGSTPKRQAITARLRHIYQLASATGKQERLVIFGSYITTKLYPNDVDVVLVMADDFHLSACDAETGLETFVAHWQITREGSRWSIVEVRL